MVHSIYPSASTGAERVCPELAGSFAIQEADVVGGEGCVSTWTDWTEEVGLGGVGVQKGRAGLGNPLTLLPLLFH